LSTVQALAILSCYHSGVAELVLSFTFLGTAIRVSQALTLEHMKLECAPFWSEIEYQRSCVYWSLYSLDKCCSLYVGRPQALTPPFDELYHFPGDHGMDIGLECFRGQHPGDQEISFTAFIWHVRLMRIISMTMKLLYGKNGVCNSVIDIGHVEHISLQLERWKRGLPACLRADDDPDSNMTPPVAMVNLMREWMNILLFQPFYQDRSVIRYITGNGNQTSFSEHDRHRVSQVRDQAFQTATPAANRILLLLEKFHRQHGLHMIDNTAVQIVYVAGKIHYLGILDNSSTVFGRESPRHGMVKAIDLLRKIGATWPSAVASADRLEELSRSSSRGAGILHPNPAVPLPRVNSTSVYGDKFSPPKDPTRQFKSEPE